MTVMRPPVANPVFGAVFGTLGLPAAIALLIPMEAGVPIPIPDDLVMLLIGARTSAGDFPWWVAALALELVAVAGTCLLFFACRGPGHALDHTRRTSNRTHERTRRTRGVAHRDVRPVDAAHRTRYPGAAHDHCDRRGNIGHLGAPSAPTVDHRRQRVRATPPRARRSSRAVRAGPLRRGEGRRDHRLRRAARRCRRVLVRAARAPQRRSELVRSRCPVCLGLAAVVRMPSGPDPSPASSRAMPARPR